MKIIQHVMIVTVCAVIAIVWYQCDIKTLRQDLVLANLQEYNYQQQMKILLRQEFELEERVAQFSKVQNTLNEWQKKFIKYDDLKKLITTIKSMGRAEKLNFQTFDQAFASKDNNYHKQTFKIVMTGEYAPTATFIKQIAKLPWIVVVGDFTISRFEQSDFTPSLLTELNIDVYHLSDNKKIF